MDQENQNSAIKFDDPSTVRVEDVDVRGTVFVIPLDAPLPTELTTSGIAIPTGSLYVCLVALVMESTTEFGFIPITGLEWIGLARAWHLLQRAKKVVALTDLPGAKYETTWSLARKEIGIPAMEWSLVAEALGSRARTMQRTADKEPWSVAGKPTTLGDTTRKGPQGTNFRAMDRSVPVPPSEEGETGEDQT